ncbi:MAG: response regulator [Ruminococcus sp.]|jgi:two-component system sensor histidine kinase/response regulator|nr:response regulator [Ruminococcus sp.]
MHEETRILVTDDSEINLEIESALIENRWGIPCDTAISGDAAIKCCNEKLYSLILMDYLMPGMNGIEAAKKIKTTKWNFKTPVVALTGSDDEETAKELLEQGFADVLIKPIDEQAITEVFSKYIGINVTENRGGSEHTGAILGSLYEVEGLDVAGGLKNVAGNRNSYVKSLRILKDKIPEANERISSSLLKSDMERARLYLHSMKSSLANVGFNAVSKMAAALEKSVIDDNADFYDHNIGAFSDALEQIEKSLGKVFSASNDVIYTSSGNEDEFLKIIADILVEFDNFRFMEAKEIAFKLSEVNYGKRLNKIATDLVEALDSFDYEKATAIIKNTLA